MSSYRKPGRKGLLLTVALSALLSGCADSGDSGDNVAAPPPPPPAPSSATPSPSPSPSSTVAPPPSAPAGSCAALIDGMTPRQQVAQLVVVGVEGEDVATPTNLVRQEQIGGIFIGGNATQLLSDRNVAKVQEAAKVPISVAVDEEGGRVQRVDALDGSIPSPRVMGKTMSADQVRDIGRSRGQQLTARGVTVDYAPVVDIGEQPNGGAVGDRSFSPDPNMARDYARAFADGLRESGVASAFKHFPGHGNADGDSHATLVSTPPLAQLKERDLVPYQGISDVPEASVMVGHLNVPDLTNGEPASLSEPVYQLLRNEYGFNGPVITDDLGAMKAIKDRYTLPDAALKALRSGADQALWSSGGRTGEVLDRLEQAVSSGELPADQVRRSLDRVLPAKKACTA